jgi:NAD-dependent dihydropyrimidine dehydrogenase PreA subunit
MTYTITETCIGTKDRSCIDVCPVDCIHDDVHKDGVADDASQDRILYIDPDECIDCGACEPACPVTAIFAEDDVPDNMKAYTEINALWFKDRDAARAKVAAIAPK